VAEQLKTQLKVDYQIEPILTAWPDIKPLIEAHWEEVALNKDKIKLAINEDYYRKREADGSLVMVTVRDPNERSWYFDPGKLVGYCILLIMPHPHYKNDTMALFDVYYVRPEYRKGRVGLNMFKFVEAKMRERGVVKMIAGNKLHRDIGRLFEHLGWTEIERTFSKYIGDE
jgi:GNAT superfamily N-acetyltransferase